MHILADSIFALWLGPTERLASLVVGGVLLTSSLVAMTRLLYVAERSWGIIKETAAILQRGGVA
jgi:hypothetical protein